VLGHQLGEHFVLGLDFLLQPGDAFLLGGTAVAGLGLEGGGAVLKEFFLPAIEYRRLQSEFVAELRDRLVLDQMPPQNGDLLFGCVVLSLFPHASSPLA
jgi:hypothetical protein